MLNLKEKENWGIAMNNYLPTEYQAFIHKSRYARWLDKEKRREEWSETVERYMDNVIRPVIGDDSYVNQIRDAILTLEVMPSMRAMMTAGPAVIIALMEGMTSRLSMASRI